ncbi:hypothetical protein F4820DRAFT_432761 [Hypoxylon rubiginosum]|uniref:Uncharacterized protein n=1 Tax=Hypoxylon rubiginosum TaxID=110542 RepID=A0ACB9YQI9_9PEZI|nr:hypothetical protein F4820DRAFT_432761 [Hypoxylon rubiginosum]
MYKLLIQVDSLPSYRCPHPIPTNIKLDTMALVATSTQLMLLNLPIEIRLEIYSYLLNGETGYCSETGYYGDYGCNRISADVPYRVQWTGYRHNLLSPLLVCRQLHQEIAPLIYRAVTIGNDGFDPTLWQDFFRMIGPTNAGYIRDVEIDYHCESDSGYDHYGGMLEYPWTSADLWRMLFDTMYEAGVRPKRIDLNVQNCGTNCANGTPARLRCCKTWKNLDFLRSLSWFFHRVQRVQRVALSGDFHPLWPYALKARFGLQTICQSKTIT